MLYRQRILGPDIDDPLVGADGVGADDHAFENRMGIALQNGSVHVGAGIPFVGIADDVPDSVGGFGAAAGFPLAAGGEPSPSPAPQLRAFQLLDYLLGAHSQHLGQGGVTFD